MISVTITTPTGVQFDGQGDEVTMPTTTGRIGVRRGHRALITPLKKGTVVVKKDSGERQTFEIKEGFVEVRPDRVSIMARDTK